MSVTLTFFGQFTASKVGKTGLTVTVDVRRITRSDGTITASVTGGSATEITSGRGGYFYRLTGADLTLYDYYATFITSDTTVDAKEVPAAFNQYAVSASLATAATEDSKTLITSGTGTGQLSVTSGKVVLADAAHGGTSATLTLNNIQVSCTDSTKSAFNIEHTNPGGGSQVGLRIHGASSSGVDILSSGDNAIYIGSSALDSAPVGIDGNAAAVTMNIGPDGTGNANAYRMLQAPQGNLLLFNNGAGVEAMPLASAIDTQLSGTHGAGAWGGASGAGAYTYTVTVTDGTSPLQNATVSMVEGTNRYTASTNASGVATFNLDAATYTLAIVKAGYSYAGSSVVVSGAGNTNAAMSAVTIPAPPSQAQTTVYFYTTDASGVPTATKSVSIRLVAVPAGTGSAYSGAIVTTVSITGGLWTATMLKGATYAIWHGTDREAQQFTIPTTAGDSYALPNIIIE